MIFKAGMIEWIERLQDQTVVAADIGASSKRKSFGLAWQQQGGLPDSKSLTFGKAVQKVQELIVGQREVVLILEAPLSGLYQNKNPLYRSFERQPQKMKVENNLQLRDWYFGAGATTALHALILLHRLNDQRMHDQGDETTVYLYEAFVSFKASKQSDADDAVAIRDSFLGKRQSIPRRPPFGSSMNSCSQKEESLSLLRLIGITDSEDIPAVIEIKND